MEAALKERRASPVRSAAATGKTTLLGKLDGASSAQRRSTGSNELDRVVGGGLVPGSVVLLGGGLGVAVLAGAVVLLRRKQSDEPRYSRRSNS